MRRPPRFDLDPVAFYDDPYPVMAEMRRRAPLAWVPALNGLVFTRHDDISVAEKNVAVFSSDQPEGLMQQLMGHNMMRKDGKAHMAERKIMLQALSTRRVREHWHGLFQNVVDDVIATLEGKSSFDLVTDLAMPMSAGCLQAMTGLTNATAKEFDHWSQAMIDGIANYSGDAATQKRCLSALAAMDDAMDERMAVLRKAPDESLLSVMLEANLPEDSIRANIKLTISGGQNEPRDAISGTVWSLLSYRDELEKIKTGTATWEQAFVEYLRWMSPIGMSPRRIAQDAEFNGFELKADQRVFFLFSSANRDSHVFKKPDSFRVERDASRHLAFGAGPHYCVGAWASKAMIADVALPTVFSRMPELHIPKDSRASFLGWAFRGLQTAVVAA